MLHKNVPQLQRVEKPVTLCHIIHVTSYCGNKIIPGDHGLVALEDLVNDIWLIETFENLVKVFLGYYQVSITPQKLVLRNLSSILVIILGQDWLNTGSTFISRPIWWFQFIVIMVHITLIGICCRFLVSNVLFLLGYELRQEYVLEFLWEYLTKEDQFLKCCFHSTAVPWDRVLLIPTCNYII